MFYVHVCAFISFMALECINSHFYMHSNDVIYIRLNHEYFCFLLTWKVSFTVDCIKIKNIGATFAYLGIAINLVTFYLLLN